MCDGNMGLCSRPPNSQVELEVKMTARKQAKSLEKCPCQESGVYTFMNLLPRASIIEGGGSQGPSPLTASMIFLHHCKTLLGKKKKRSERVGAVDGRGGRGRQKCTHSPVIPRSLQKKKTKQLLKCRWTTQILFLTFLSPSVIKKEKHTLSPVFAFSFIFAGLMSVRETQTLPVGSARAAMNSNYRPLSPGIPDAWLSERSFRSKVVHAERR